MKIVSCVGSKGGSGKSHIANLISYELAVTHKSKVVLFDADIQGTCISAKAVNSKIPFEIISVTNKTDVWERAKFFSESSIDYVVIDGNPRSLQEDPDLIEMIAKLSDLNLIISRPSPHDIKAQLKYVDLVHRVTNGEIRILWNFVQNNTSSHKAGIPQGEKLLGLRSLETKICLRIAYQDLGYTEGYIGDLGNSAATDEIHRLGIEVKELLNGKK